jgi:predicted aspartyl protease
VTEILEFDSVYEYSLSKVGISVDATLQNGDYSVDIDTRIDTGATYCIFERYYGERLNLKIEEGIPIEIGTATGSFRAFGHELTLTVLGIETVSTVYFAENDYFDRNVLGRIGWLDRVKLGLIEQEGKLFLSEYRKS